MKKWLKNVANVFILLGVMLLILSIDTYTYGYMEWVEYIGAAAKLLWPVIIGVGIYLIIGVYDKYMWLVDWWNNYQQDMAELAWYRDKEYRRQLFKQLTSIRIQEDNQ